jgi:hypothetical protein
VCRYPRAYRFIFVFIIPSSWGSQLDSAFYYQHRAASPIASEAIAAEPVASEGGASKRGAFLNWASLKGDGPLHKISDSLLANKEYMDTYLALRFT